MWSFSPLEKLTSGVAENRGRKPRQREQRWGSLRALLRSAPCRRGRTSPALVTRRAPRDSQTRGLETPGRWIPLALLLGLNPLASQAVFLGGEKKLPLDLVGPMPLSSRGCLMPPSHLLSDGLASRWPGNYALPESRARDHKVADSWSCGQRAGGAGRLVLLAPAAPCKNLARCSRPASSSAPRPHLLPSLQRR